MPLNPEVCGKIPTCRAHWIATRLLPAVSLHEKGGVLGGSKICRILPLDVSGSAVKTKIGRPHPCFRLPRPAVLLLKIGLCSAFSDFSQHFRNDGFTSHVLAAMAASATTSSSRETSKGRCRNTEQRPFFLYASRRVHDDCITGKILP